MSSDFRLTGLLQKSLGRFSALLERAPLAGKSKDIIRRWVHDVGALVLDNSHRLAYERFGTALGSLRMENSGTRAGLLHMIGTLGPGGSERQLVATLGQLAKLKSIPLSVAVRFLQTEDQRFFLPHLQQCGIPVEEIPPCTGTPDSLAVFAALRSLPKSMGDVGDYIGLLSRKRPAILHLWLDEVNIKGGLAAVATGVPRIILGMRSLPPCNFGLHQPYMRQGYRWLARQRGVAMINNSEAGARAYEKWIGLAPHSIHVIRNGYVMDGVTLDRYCRDRMVCRERFGIPGNAPLIGTVMRLSEEKRPILWLEIASRVKRALPDARFLVVGDGLMRQDVREHCCKLELSSAVHFTGYSRDAFACIAAMDLLLLTSRAEGMPNVLVEAQMLRVPVVSTKAGGACEALDHGRTGVILERDDADFASKAIVKALTDLNWYEKAKNRCREFASERFGIDRMMRELMRVYGA